MADFGRLETAMVDRFRPPTALGDALRAALARLPLAPALRKIGAVWAADIVSDPQAAESHVFGSFFLDARSVGALWMLPHARLSDVLKADLGLDIGVSLPGSKGFGPADQAPATNVPSASTLGTVRRSVMGTIFSSR